MNAGTRCTIANSESSEVGLRLAPRRNVAAEVLTPADRAGRGPVEVGPLPEDEAAVQTLGRLHAEPLSGPPERAGHVGEVIGDLLLRDPD